MIVALFSVLVACVVLAPFALSLIAPAAWSVMATVAAGVGMLENMKYKRHKPNYEPWKKRPSPQTEPTHPLDDARQRVEALLAPLVAELASISASLDEVCAVNGHRWSEHIYSDRIVCATCGRDREEVYQKAKSMN